ncbi:ABC transporter substrate-binding protein, partial [bacterium]|nr:ABC transporter substrate-binding protein [bacterium]
LQGVATGVYGISAPTEFSVKMQLNEAFAPFLGLLSIPSCSILPSDSEAAIKDQSFFEKPFGTGPFLVEERERDGFILLTANSNYHGNKPQIKHIDLKIIPEVMKAEMDFESGNLDLLQLYPSNYDRFAEKPEYKTSIHNVPAMNVFYIGFNNQKPPFNDVRVRIALNKLLNREAIIQAIYKNRAVVAHGSIPPGIIGYSKDAPGYKYEPESGKSLLKEAGYGPDHPLSFDLFQKSSQAAFEITQLIQGELRPHGVQVNLKPMEWSALKDAVNKGEAQAFYMSWFGDYPDGENFLFPLFHSNNWGSGGNRARFKDEAVDKLLQEALKIQDGGMREAAYDKINRLVFSQAPWLYLWHSDESYLLGNRVEKMSFSPLFPVEKGLSIRIKPE